MNMKTPLSPLDLEVLLWCHYRTGPHERLDAPAVNESLSMWRDCGMIERIGNTFTTTEKGCAMVKALCRTPEPKCVWVVGGVDV